MHNWRLLLLAFLALLEPIASFECSLVDGREKRCERDSRIEGRSYGTYRISKTSPDIRQINLREIRGDIRYDARLNSVLSRSSVERKIRDSRSGSDREHRSTFRAGPSEERRLFNRYTSNIITNRDNQNQDISRVTRALAGQDDRIRNSAFTFQQSRDRFVRSEDQRSSRIAEATRGNTASPKDRQIRVTLLRARDNLAEPETRIERVRSRVLEERRDFAAQKFRPERSHNRERRGHWISRSSELNAVRRQLELRSRHSEGRDLRARSDEGRIANLRDSRISAERQVRSSSESRVDQRRSAEDNRRSVIRSERTIKERFPALLEMSAESRQSLSQRTRHAGERRALSSRLENTRERRFIDREERRDTLRVSTVDRRSAEDNRRSVIRSERTIKERSPALLERSAERRQSLSQLSRDADERRDLPSRLENMRERRSIDREERRVSNPKESRLVRNWESRSESRNDRPMTRRNNEVRNTGSDRRITENRSLDHSNGRSAERAMEREFEIRFASRQLRERRINNLEGESRGREFRTINSRDITKELRLTRLQSRDRTTTPESYIQARDERVKRSIRRDFRNNARNVQDSRRFVRVSELREETGRLANPILERRELSKHQESRRNIRQVTPTRFEYRFSKNNLEREDARFRNTEFTRHLFSVREKTQSDDQAPMNWLYLMYTLQGIYICGILVQLLSANESAKKSSAFTWWTGSSRNLIKMD